MQYLNFLLLVVRSYTNNDLTIDLTSQHENGCTTTRINLIEKGVTTSSSHKTILTN